MSTNAVVAAIGLALGRGTLTSIALVLLALPQTLLVGDMIIEKTAFTLKREMAKPLPAGGRIRMTGHIKGYVNGVIEGEFSGVIDGEMGAVVRARDTVEQLREYMEMSDGTPRLEAEEVDSPESAGVQKGAPEAPEKDRGETEGSGAEPGKNGKGEDAEDVEVVENPRNVAMGGAADDSGKKTRKRRRWHKNRKKQKEQEVPEDEEW